jgi:transposase
MYEKSSDEERLDNRKNSVKPLVDAYFEWVKEYAGKAGLDKS